MGVQGVLQGGGDAHGRGGGLFLMLYMLYGGRINSARGGGRTVIWGAGRGCGGSPGSRPTWACRLPGWGSRGVLVRRESAHRVAARAPGEWVAPAAAATAGAAAAKSRASVSSSVSGPPPPPPPPPRAAGGDCGGRCWGDDGLVGAGGATVVVAAAAVTVVKTAEGPGSDSDDTLGEGSAAHGSSASLLLAERLALAPAVLASTSSSKSASSPESSGAPSS